MENDYLALLREACVENGYMAPMVSPKGDGGSIVRVLGFRSGKGEAEGADEQSAAFAFITTVKGWTTGDGAEGSDEGSTWKRVLETRGVYLKNKNLTKKTKTAVVTVSSVAAAPPEDTAARGSTYEGSSSGLGAAAKRRARRKRGIDGRMKGVPTMDGTDASGSGDGGSSIGEVQTELASTSASASASASRAASETAKSCSWSDVFSVARKVEYESELLVEDFCPPTGGADGTKVGDAGHGGGRDKRDDNDDAGGYRDGTIGAFCQPAGLAAFVLSLGAKDEEVERSAPATSKPDAKLN